MDDPQQSRISQILTNWSLIGDAHGDASERASQAKVALLVKYERAILKYLHALVRDADQVDEIYQDFAIQLLKGRFRHADPTRGRFRSYLKTALIRMVFDDRRRRTRLAKQVSSEAIPLLAADEQAQIERQFDEGWRQELLDRSWALLRQQEQSSGQLYYTVLRCKADNPNMTSTELAQELTTLVSPRRPYSAAGARKLLQRAREAFRRLLVAEVAETLPSDDWNDIERELADLQLLSLCKPAVQRQRAD